MKTCDLHTHSNYSDGSFTPKEIIDAAIEIGLSAVALCDHNTVDGLNEFLSAANGKNIEAIAGVEFSVEYKGKEVHLLGLFIPKSEFTKVADLMKDVNLRKEKSNIDLINALNKDGYVIDYESIKKSTPKGNVNRSHIADELITCGYVQSKDEAFSSILSTKAGYYKEPARLQFLDIVDFIKSIGAVPVLAHPFLNLSENELEEVLPLAKEHGLVGMECYYSEYDQNTTQKALMIADKFHLKYSGGSDFHGKKKIHIKLGEKK